MIYIIRLLLLRHGFLVTLQTFVFTHITSVMKSAHTFIAWNKVSYDYLIAEPCFHLPVNFGCFATYIFGFHHKQSASD